MTKLYNPERWAKSVYNAGGVVYVLKSELSRSTGQYGPKTKIVKNLELIDQNNIWLILNTASKLCKFTGYASCNSIFDTFFTKFFIS